MKHSLADLGASGARVVKITGTNCLRDGEWLTYALAVRDDGELLYGLFVTKDMLTTAEGLFPEALSVQPYNNWLVKTQ